MCNCAYNQGDKVQFRDIVGEITSKKDMGDYCDIIIKFERGGVESQLTTECRYVKPSGK